ncbi:MAG TPA: carbohydrate-binding protein [Niabella sp.]|nr:carbohydrate-binding protein [Niabella sp.]
MKKMNEILMCFACFAVLVLGISSCQRTALQDIISQDNKLEQTVPRMVTLTSVKYEAENGTIGNGAQVQNASAASGGKVIGSLNNVGAFVRINSVNGGNGGSVTVQVRYSNGYSNTRTLSLYINGVDVKQLSFPSTGSWNSFSTIETTVSLNQGSSNTIALQRNADDQAAADIDYFSLTPGGTPPGSDWLSGTATKEVGNGADPAQYFSNWRGTPVEIGQTWPNTPDAWGINPQISNSWAGFQGPMSISYDPGPDWVNPATGQTLTGWRNWATVANGGNDAWWTAAAKKVKALRAGRGTTYISPFYEFNGDWMAWSVPRNAQGYADFKAGWKRVSDIWRREFPQAKLVLPAAMSRDVPAAMMPDPSTYDLGGGTIYNAWPWEANGATAIQRLEAFRQQVAAVGKPFGITEWANSANPNTDGGGGDAPGFITAMHNWMKQHAGTGAGQLVFETFFNIPGYVLDHELIHWNGSAVQVSTTQPQTAARYRDLF